jgi:hypothetical protein
MGSTSADPTFGLNLQSLAVLYLMTGQYIPLEEPPKTFPWYNGRENGISFVVPHGKGCRVIVVGEDSRSEALFVEHWDQPGRPFNAPTIDQREAVGVRTVRTVFEAGGVSLAAGHAVQLIRESLGGV